MARLRLDRNVLRGAGVEALVDAGALEHVQELGLHRTDAGEQGAQALAASPALGGLRHLHLGQSGLGASGWHALCRASWEALEELDVHRNHVDAAAMEAWPEAKFGSLRTLVLWGNALGPRGAHALAAGPELIEEAMELLTDLRVECQQSPKQELYEFASFGFEGCRDGSEWAQGS